MKKNIVLILFAWQALTSCGTTDDPPLHTPWDETASAVTRDLPGRGTYRMLPRRQMWKQLLQYGKTVLTMTAKACCQVGESLREEVISAWKHRYRCLPQALPLNVRKYMGETGWGSNAGRLGEN